ncbi:MAG: DUF262 domain-containing protein [Termitinemataceae bacterium]|nr:MAG: DUF262 domain-containing protein [Termitinemataceae bacterium]
MAGSGTNLTISKKSIAALFKDIKGHKFVIPDYQRPYKWELDECDTLWKDVVENFSNPDDYFFGTIVTCKNQDGDIEIIDGQQRITSFFLLLRAFYKKLELSNPASENVIGLKNQVAPCIWDTDDISQKVTDLSNIHIESKVAIEEDNETFHDILKTGVCGNNKDNYSTNYSYFKRQCDDYAQNNPTEWEKLCVFVLNKCIILPIECDAEDTALTIFSTLNDRGLPLSDSDIFKAKLYRESKTKEEQKEFTDAWKELTEICKDAYLEIDDVFRYYMHVIRARKNINKKEIGLRRFYGENNYDYLRQQNLLDEIMVLAKFWMYIKTREDPEKEDGYIISLEAKKWLHCLSLYPNDYWKYPVSVFFLKNKKNENFDKEFCLLLKQEIAFLFAEFIISPTINAIRDEIYNVYISIALKDKPKFNFEYETDILKKRMLEYTSPKITRALLLLDAYLNQNQKNLIPIDFHVEHIFPQKWQDTNYNGWDEKDAQKYLELYGNKIILEWKINIQAGNGYFGRKKNKYKNSKIAAVLELGQLKQNDWLKADIEKREERFCKTIMDFFVSSLNL